MTEKLITNLLQCVRSRDELEQTVGISIDLFLMMTDEIGRIDFQPIKLMNGKADKRQQEQNDELREHH